MNATKELVRYLKEILFNPNNLPLKEPDLEAADPAVIQLSEGLTYLAKSIECFKNYANELSVGNLSVAFPPKENLFCTSLKNLHANLNHLTWQAQQIASGDYSQHVDYLGDFSIAFNTMISQLSERESLLKQYAYEKEKQAEHLLSYNELLISLMSGRREWVFVINPESHDLLYCNKLPYGSGSDDTSHDAISPQITHFLNWIKKSEKPRQNGSWELHDPKDGLSYLVNTISLEWRGLPGIAFIINDITKEREDEKRLSDLAYKDTFTRIYNRRYLLENMEKLIHTGASFSFCYIDIDHLKAINDTYGHAEGDRYILSIVDLIKNGIRQTDIFARIGGDEFAVLLLKCPKEQASKKMMMLYEQTERLSGSSLPYHASFSYGIVEVPTECKELSVEAIMGIADAAMYQFKERHK